MRLSHLLPVAFALCFEGLALAAIEAEHSTATALAFLGLYALLAVALYFLVLTGQRLGPRTGFAAAAAVGLVLVWHARELTYRPGSLLLVPVAALVAAVPIWALSRSDDGSWRRALAGAGAALVLLGAAWLGVFHASPLLRWHLLRHHKMLGTPAYYLLARDVVDVQEELYDRYRGEEEATLPRVGAPREDAVPHLVFVLLDTLRADALEMGGGARGAMPRLDAFLDSAWRFTDVVASSSWTRPSMASMMTGLLPEEHGARDVDDPLTEDLETLAEIYRGWGYETAALVSNIGAVGRSAGFAQGFDVFHELEADPYARAGQIRRALERWLSGREGETRPLFLYLHFLDPHEPYLAGRVPRAKSRAEYAAAYRAELAYLDRELAAVFELLDEKLPGRRGVFVASDHGEELFEHEEFGHGYSLYGEVVRIPAAFRTGTPGGELGQPLEGRDVFDLLVRWGAAGGGLDVAAWAEERRRARRYYSIYYSSEGRLLLRPYLRRVCMRAVEDGGYKLVWSAYGSTVELYDLERDPGERRNLAAAEPEVVERLLPLLDASVRAWRFPAPYERTPEELEQLRNLGYLDD